MFPKSLYVIRDFVGGNISSSSSFLIFWYCRRFAWNLPLELNCQVHFLGMDLPKGRGTWSRTRAPLCDHKGSPPSGPPSWLGSERVHVCVWAGSLCVCYFCTATLWCTELICSLKRFLCGTDFMWCFLELCTPSEKMTFHAQEYWNWKYSSWLGASRLHLFLHFGWWACSWHEIPPGTWVIIMMSIFSASM